MSFGQEDFDFTVMDDRVILSDSVINSYGGDAEYWRTDCYGNDYFTQGSHFQVEPEAEDFPEQMKHHLAYLVNLTELNERGFAPDFETGVKMEREVRPYTVVEKPDGRPLTDFDRVLDLLDQEEWKSRFEELNLAGKRLASQDRIIYPQPRRNEDVFVDKEQEQFIYINPGTFIDQARFNQFTKSHAVPSDRSELGKWLSKDHWQEIIR